MAFAVVLHVLLFISAAGGLLACSLRNFTLHMEKQDCGGCLAINTTICSGMCHSQDTNLRGFVWRRFRVQSVCVYKSVTYRSAKVPGCPSHIDPVFVYPVARLCHCSKCNTVRNECVHLRRHAHSGCRYKHL